MIFFLPGSSILSPEVEIKKHVVCEVQKVGTWNFMHPQSRTQFLAEVVAVAGEEIIGSACPLITKLINYLVYPCSGHPGSAKNHSLPVRVHGIGLWCTAENSSSKIAESI